MSIAEKDQIRISAEEAHISRKKPFAFCVDDEELNLEILEMHLKKAGFNSKGFISGVELLNYLESDGDKELPDVILLDIMMPLMDGIAVLRKLKERDDFKEIPVILQTAVTQESKNIEGIDAGAYYYITKPYSHSVLISIVKSAIKEKRENETLKNDIVTLNSVINNVRSCAFEVSRFQEARKLANYISRFSSDPKKYVVGLTALIINSIEHGNLALGYELKSQLMKDNQYDEEIESRLENPLYRNKKVVIEVYRKDEEGVFAVIIKDEGDGFNWQDYTNFDPTRMIDPNGRGIATATIINPNGIEYWGKGNVVVYKLPIKESIRKTMQM